MDPKRETDMHKGNCRSLQMNPTVPQELKTLAAAILDVNAWSDSFYSDLVSLMQSRTELSQKVTELEDRVRKLEKLIRDAK